MTLHDLSENINQLNREKAATRQEEESRKARPAPLAGGRARSPSPSRVKSPHKKQLSVERTDPTGKKSLNTGSPSDVP